MMIADKMLKTVLLAAFLLPVLPLFAENLLVNSGLETGTTEGWGARFGAGAIEVITSNPEPHSGTYCLRDYNRSQTWHGVVQSQNLVGILEPGVTYPASVWVRTNTATPVTVNLTVQENGGNPTPRYIGVSNVRADNTQWYLIQGNYTCPSDPTQITYYIEASGSATCEIYVDDAVLGAAHIPDIDPATDPVPADKDSIIDSETTSAVTWTAPEGPDLVQVNGYTVYFGTDPNIKNNPAFSVTAESLPVTLDYSTTYYWRVDSDVVVDTDEITVEGSVWSFTTLSSDASPIVTAGDDILTSIEFLPATLTATVNDFGEGDIISVEWEVLNSELATVTDTTNDPSSSSQSAILDTASAGIYEVQITVTDSTYTVTDTLFVTVTLPFDDPPIVTAGNDVLTSIELLPVTLTATVDDSGEDDIISIDWEIQGGLEATVTDITNDPSSSSQSATFDTDSPGVYEVRITVTDSTYTVTGTIFITVTVPAVLYPAGDLNLDFTVDIKDLIIFAGQWLEDSDCTPPNCAELDGFDVVTMSDFSILGANWLEDYGLPLVINEFMASNGSTSGISDPQGQFDDWIEIHNFGETAIDVGGMYLTDDLNNPTAWQFPSNITIAAGGFLVVWADEDVADTPGLHANFQLNSNGDEIGLFETDGTTLTDSVVFGNQISNISYGRWPDGYDDLRYFSTPTLAAQNNNAYYGLLEDTKFSHNRGFYDAPFSLTITCETQGVEIYFTTDGSDPIENEFGTGTLYTGPISISENVCIRAAAVKTGWRPTNIDTHTYVFNANGVGAYDLNDMKSLQVFSIVGDPDTAFWGETGIFKQPEFTYRGIDYERPVSFEILDAQTGNNIQVDCGIRVQGSTYHRDRYLDSNQTANWHGTAYNGNKIGTKLYFRGSLYGDKELDYPIFPLADTDKFETINIRSGFNDMNNPFVNDEWFRRLNQDMGGVASTGTIVNFFLNGKFKSYFNPCQRYDNHFFRDYYNVDTDWDVITQLGVRDGDTDTWNADRSFFMNHDMSDPANYIQAGEMIDIVNLIDYLIIELYSTNNDWPGNNWTVSRERTEEGKWRFHCWDMEFVAHVHDLNPLAHINANDIPDLRNDSGFTVFFNRLESNPEFRLLFADRIQKHFFYDGALTQLNLIKRYNELKQQTSQVLNMNTAMLDDFIPNRTSSLLNIFNSEGLFPSQGPDFKVNGVSQHGGYVLSSDVITITETGPSGTIYYTIEGSDPRNATGIDPNAIEYTGGFQLSQSTELKSRVLLTSGQWSALHEASYGVGPVKENLRISELMYHPQDPNDEFVELINTGSETINLNLVRLTKGVDFTFGPEVLAPDEYILLVRNQNSFMNRYPSFTGRIAGQYAGALDDAGENIRLRDAANSIIHEFSYKDGWYDITDGDGFSLTIRDADSADPNDWAVKEGWRPSALAGGSPGYDDAGFLPEPGSVVINEVLAHSHTTAPDWIELYNTTGQEINIGGWFLSDSNADDPNMMKYEIPHGTSINAYDYYVFYENTSFGNPNAEGVNIPFGLSEGGDSVYLRSGTGGVIGGYEESESFGASASNIAFGRHIKSVLDGGVNFVAMSENTPGEQNAYPQVGPIVITEIMYHPAADNTGGEYLELHNITNQSVMLQDSVSTETSPGVFRTDVVPWQFSDGIDFDFPANTTIPAQGYLIIAADPTAFVNYYGPMPSGVNVLGPFQNATALSNGGEQVQIVRPGDQEYGCQRYWIRTERVTYDDQSPWPVSPDGNGDALLQKTPDTAGANYGNDVINWQAAPPSPGQ